MEVAMMQKMFGILILAVLLTAGCKKGSKAPAEKAATKTTKEVKKQAAAKAGLVAPRKFTGTLAVVNGEKLGAEALNRDLARLTQNGRRKLPQDRLERVESSIRNRLIDDMLITQAATKAGIQVTDADIQKDFEKYKGRFASPRQFDTYMKRARMTKEAIQGWIKKKLTLEKLLDKKGALKVTEDEAKKVYENNIRLYTEPERVRLQGIMITLAPNADKAAKAAAQAKVKTVLAALAKGDAFVEVAKKYSDDVTKDKGGNMGWVRHDMLPAVLETAAFGLKPGQYTKTAVKGPKGLYILKSLDKKDKKVKTFAEVKDRIMASLRNRKVFTARLKLVKDLRANAKIVIKQKFSKDKKKAVK